MCDEQRSKADIRRCKAVALSTQTKRPRFAPTAPLKLADSSHRVGSAFGLKPAWTGKAPAAVNAFTQKDGAHGTKEEWVIWNGSLGVLDMVTIGRIEDGDTGKTAFLASPYGVVGPFMS
jgi:hypothetical protein